MKFPFSLCAVALFVAAFSVSATADVVTVEVTIKSVDAKDRTITATRKGKTLELDVSRKAKVTVKGKDATLAKLPAGQTAKIDYETNLEIITKIEVTGKALPEPELVRLNELDSEGFEDSLWVSSDGLTIYWCNKTGSEPRWGWTARGRNAASHFENKRKLLPCVDLTVSDDDLEMIILQHGSADLATARRRKVSEPFRRPVAIKEFGKRFGFLAAPCFSGDALSLYFDRIQDGRNVISVSTRRTKADVWSPPRPVRLTVSGHKIRVPHVTDDGKYLFCVAVDIEEDNKPNILFYSRDKLDEPFQHPTFVEVDGIVVHGKFPRYIAATNELFFSRKGAKGEQELVVLKNFSPATMIQKAE